MLIHALFISHEINDQKVPYLQCPYWKKDVEKSQCNDKSFLMNLSNNFIGVMKALCISCFVWDRSFLFQFSLQADSLPSCHSKLLKYADDFVLCNSYSKRSDQEGLNDDWMSADRVFIESKTKCFECPFLSGFHTIWCHIGCTSTYRPILAKDTAL